ncbi:MAG: fructose-bisphosphatase class III [Lachnoclostridium sp.]|nr:fructose-bisphosphatase class III [Lachnospira sp.]MCM1249464.1 fructose-bisphosphatase class III [Lachnoclostridium sp.]MCM1536264.1 fructose-bisphosphatase class III [Clostridium sp.]
MFRQLIEKIRLKESDTLYVLGDIVDRGPHPIKVLLMLMEMPNVICLAGNHELMALECLEFLMQEITDISLESFDQKMLDNLMTWQINGSSTTIDEFRALPQGMREEIIDFIKDFSIYEEVIVAGKAYLLVHGGLGNFYPGKDIDDYSIKELIWDRAEYDIQYYEDKYVVTGHTPTQEIIGNPRPGYIFRENHHIALDCGCSRSDGRLAAICLDTGKEYYVPENR